MHRKKIGIILIAIILLAAFLRFFWLDRIPNAVSGDELTYIFTAKSMFLSGSDITHTWSPLSIFAFRYPPGEVQAELPYFLLLPTVGAFPFSLLAARIPYAILSLGIVVLLYLIGKKLFGEYTGLLAGFVAAINPWLIYMGRTTYESVPSTFFYFLSLYILLTAQGNAILWSIPSLSLAFYAYIGTKLVFVPFIIVTLFYMYFFVHKKKYGKQYLVVCIAMLCMVILLLTTLRGGNSSSRMGEVFLPTDQSIASGVNQIRSITMANPFTALFDNKIIFYFRILVTKTIQILSAPYLFLEGDLFFSILRHGFFYIIDSIFMLIGFYYLFKKNIPRALFLIALIGISMLPQIFHRGMNNFSNHITLLFPCMIFIIAFGITESVAKIKNTYFQKIAYIGIAMLYSISTLQFCYIYFFQHPLQGYFDFHVRILSKYLSLAEKNHTPVKIFSSSPPDAFKKYIFYTDSLNKNSITHIRNAFATRSYSVETITFLPCEALLTSVDETSTMIVDSGCKNKFDKETYLSISQLSDAGTRYKIFQDSLCSKYPLRFYPQGITTDDFLVEQMSEQKFCETYISISE